MRFRYKRENERNKKEKVSDILRDEGILRNEINTKIRERFQEMEDINYPELVYN